MATELPYLCRMTARTKPALNISNVLSVYSGRDGACCCGCKGKHYYRTESRSQASESRGYAVRDEEISDKMATKVLRIVQNADHTEVGPNYVSTVVGERLYIVYTA